MADELRVERAGHVVTVILNRPESMNSLSTALKIALLQALTDVAADDTVRAVVLTGAGRGFCAGQDLAEHSSQLAEQDPTAQRTVREHYNPIALALAQMPKPVIAAVNGVAAGAGASLAFACDLRIVSDQARFLLAFANAGLGLDTGASWTLPRLIGSARATELALLAEPISAAVAQDYGLATRVVPAEELLPTAQALAARLAAGPTLAYAAIKNALQYAASHDLAESLENEAAQQTAAFDSEDHRRAVTAFLGKQKPDFVGH